MAWDSWSVNRRIQKIVVEPTYNYQTLKGDIAMIKLSVSLKI